MFSKVSQRSLYDMFELRSIVQKMIRNPAVLPGGWKQFFFFLEEYLDTMIRDTSKLMLFLVEDHGRCPATLLQDVIAVLKSPKSVSRLDYWRVSAAMARQPVDRSAAYLSVACLDVLRQLDKSTTMDFPEEWNHLLEECAHEEARSKFVACMSFLYREMMAVSHAYPMTPETALRLAAAVTHLVVWDSMFPKLRLNKKNMADTIKEFLAPEWSLCKKSVRPLILGFAVAFWWMKRAEDTLDPRARDYVELYATVALTCCSNKSARLDLVIFNALLVLTGRFPDETSVDYLSDLPCDPREVPMERRAYPMPACAEDRHTRRGKHLFDTTSILTKYCERQGLALPPNVSYSHGPPSHRVKQGFEEFMEHIRLCEEQTSDGRQPAFKDEACRVYRSVPPRFPQKRMEILKLRLQLTNEDSASIVHCQKRKTGEHDAPTKKQRLDWINSLSWADTFASSTSWRDLTGGKPLAQKRAGGKPPVFVDVGGRRVIKGPFRLDQQATRCVCLTRLVREVLGLQECIPEQRVFVTADGQVGLSSPMIGNPGNVLGEGLVSNNESRGLCKLHEFENDWISTLENPMDVLRIVVAKNVVGASDNNTSNILVVRETRRVYGVDVGGELSKSLRLNDASLEWAFSKPPSKKIMTRMDALVEQFSKEMVDWLQCLKDIDTQRRWEQVVAEYYLTIPVSDYLSIVDLFLEFFNLKQNSGS